MTKRSYKDKDFVVVSNPASVHDGAIGVVEIREGWETDLVWLDGSAVAQAPNSLRRLQPGDRVTNP